MSVSVIRRNTEESIRESIKDDPVVIRFRLIYCLIGIATIACGVITLWESLHPIDVNQNWCKQDSTDVTFGIGWQLACALTFTICLVVALGVFEMVKGDWSLLGTYTLILLVLTILQLIFCIYFSATSNYNCFAVGVTPYLLFIGMLLLLVDLIQISRRLSLFVLGEEDGPEYASLTPVQREQRRAKKFAQVEVNKNAFRSFWSAPVHEIGGRVEVHGGNTPAAGSSAASDLTAPLNPVVPDSSSAAINTV